MGRVFHARVRQGFLARAAAERGRITILDATRPVNEVSATILHRLLDVAS
jgi:thymidylate kinase